MEHARRRGHVPVPEPRLAADRRQRSDDGGSAPALADVAPTREQQRLLHQTIAKVTEDLEAMRFNTAISALMELTNAATSAADAARRRPRRSCCCWRRSRRTWPRSSGSGSGQARRWPISRGPSDAALLKADVLEMPVQVNGKVRGKISVPAEAQEAKSSRSRKATRTSASIWPARA